MSLTDCAREASQEPLVVTDHGTPVAVLLPLENAGLETASLTSNSRFLKLIEHSRSRMRQPGGISSAEVRRRLSLTEGMRQLAAAGLAPLPGPVFWNASRYGKYEKERQSHVRLPKGLGPELLLSPGCFASGGSLPWS
jgi:antitoxin (DNA-binding transcriptional repressor) of toxin-antitoxin stability system